MGSSFAVAPEALSHPEEPEFIYDLAFQDCLAIVSVPRAEISGYVASIMGGEDAILPLRIEAIGAFTGKTLFDYMERDDFYDSPRPFRTGVLEQHPDLNIPFPEKAGVVRPEEADVRATYQLGASERGAIHAEARSGDSNGTSITLRGGLITIQGDITIASSPELTHRISEGYTFPPLPETPTLFFTGGKEEEASAYSRPSSILKLERLYDPEPHYTDVPYLPWERKQ
jgi:hypothetical protein